MFIRAHSWLNSFAFSLFERHWNQAALTDRRLGPTISLMNYKDYITIDPQKRGGKPCVRGLRITVYEVLEYLASEMTEEEILTDFPDLTKQDLKACIAFAADRERRLMTVPVAA